MKFKRNILLVSLIAIGSISFTSAQETNKIQQRKMERIHHQDTPTLLNNSPTLIKNGVITLSMIDADGKPKTEKVDLTGKSIEEAISILRQKRGEGYGEYKRKGVENRRHNQGKRGRRNKLQQNKK